ncbi:MAG TPA: helix-turn-helix domain-containing protein [Verrucomicrobiae bacterium]|nr:helix-turn-helix domain-containing protein [Verrucomicrobiae bacterium]
MEKPQPLRELIRHYFKKLDLLPEIADIYFALYTHGPQTISELARYSGIERTRIYRLMDDIQRSAVIEIESHYKRNIFKAADIANLQILISKKEQELTELQEDFAKIDTIIRSASHSSPVARVQFYQGSDGVKQMMWNQTRSKEGTANYSILFENMQSRTQRKFFERWVRRCNEKNQVFRGIIGDNFINTQREWYSSQQNERLANWQARYVPDSLFKITYSTVIYDNVVSYYNWRGGEIFGIEIYNQDIADAQKQFFHLLWQQAQPVDDLVGPKKQ